MVLIGISLFIGPTMNFDVTVIELYYYQLLADLFLYIPVAAENPRSCVVQLIRTIKRARMFQVRKQRELLEKLKSRFCGGVNSELVLIGIYKRNPCKKRKLKELTR